MSDNQDRSREAAYIAEAERRFRHQVPNDDPLPDFRDTELPFKAVFSRAFDLGYSARDAEVERLRTALEAIKESLALHVRRSDD